jgi:hypothetical protein
MTKVAVRKMPLARRIWESIKGHFKMFFSDYSESNVLMCREL